MKITAAAVSYGLCYVSEYLNDDLRVPVSIVFVFVVLLAGTVGFIRLLIKDSDSFNLSFKNRYLSFSDKCGIAASSISVVVGFTIIIIHTIINITFTISV